MNQPLFLRPKLSGTAVTFGLEAVNVQVDNDLGYKIQAQFSLIHDLLRSGQEISPRELRNSTYLTKVKKLIKEKLGVTIDVITNGPLAAVLPFYSNKNHIMIHKEFRGSFHIDKQDVILRHARNRTATFDQVTGKMGGLFADYDHPVYMDFSALFGVYKLTPAEVTAVFLHEIGHIAAACEYADRLESTNQILADVTQHLLTKKTNPDMKFVYTELSKIDNKISNTEVDKMCNGNRVIAGYYWYKFVVKATVGDSRTQMRNDHYDRTSFEALADNFATRFGYGGDLTSGLTKLHDAGLSPERSKIWMRAHQLMSASVFIAAIVATVSLLVGGAIFMGVVYAFTIYVMTIGSADANQSYTYDKLKDRYKRIREQYVQQLKDIHLNKDQTQIILDNIDAADETIQGTYKYSTMFTFFGNLLVDPSDHVLSSIEEQQLMESLANNDLFVQAARLRTL